MAEGSRSRMILVVEDDATIRDALCDVLALAGHRAVGAENGRAALAAAERIKPEIILLDLRMPVMGGVAFLRTFQEIGLSGRVIVLTANPQDLPRDFEIPLLAKPYRVDALLRVIES